MFLTSRGGGVNQKWEISHLFFAFFIDPFPKFLLVDVFWFAVQLFWLGRWAEIRANMDRFRRRRRGRAHQVQRRQRQDYDQADWDDAVELHAIRRFENEVAPPPYE